MAAVGDQPPRGPAGVAEERRAQEPDRQERELRRMALLHRRDMQARRSGGRVRQLGPRTIA